VAVVAVVLGLDEMLFALAPQGGRPTEATCAFAGALVNVFGVNVLGFGVWTLIYTAPRGTRSCSIWCAQYGAPSRSSPPSSCCSIRKLRAARRLPHGSSGTHAAYTPPTYNRKWSPMVCAAVCGMPSVVLSNLRARRPLG
jgi:hypothetical protein